MSEITHVLQAIGRGEGEPAAELLPLVYEELRRHARMRMAQEAPGHTLQPTALVHEAWLRMFGDGDRCWQNRAHFFGAAAEAMRRILIEAARKKSRLKRGGDQVRDWIHVEDHARALLGVLARGQVGGKYLIGAEEPRRNLEIAELVCDLVDRVVPRNASSRSLIAHVADRPGHDRRYAIDSAHARAEIGWRPTRSLSTTT